MPFTNLEIVKKHLTDYRLGTRNIENEAFLMPTSDYANLQYANIKPESEKVKAREINTPFSESVVLDGTETVSLTHGEIIPDSVVVADNSSLGQIFTENIDYTINYNDGAVTRIADGAIPSASEVTIWYQYYRVYVRDTDYTIDYIRGRLKRQPEGDIEAGQVVYTDYISQYGNITDEALSNAIVEAADKVLAVIDPIYESSTDQALITAETYLTMAIICRIKAIEAAGRQDQIASGYRGDFWLKLHDSYTSEALKLLRPYAQKASELSSPRLANAGEQ